MDFLVISFGALLLLGLTLGLLVVPIYSRVERIEKEQKRRLLRNVSLP